MNAVKDVCIGDQTNTWDTSAPTVPLDTLFPPPEGSTSLPSSGSDDITRPLVIESKLQRDSLSWVISAFMNGHVGRDSDVRHALVLKNQVGSVYTLLVLCVAVLTVTSVALQVILRHLTRLL